jgi:hypothetical protein
MRADTDNTIPPSTPLRDALAQEWLTDMIDQLDRKAFRRALERRHAAVPYRHTIEAAHVVPTTSA